jgi:hypothetical protein
LADWHRELETERTRKGLKKARKGKDEKGFKENEGETLEREAKVSSWMKGRHRRRKAKKMSKRIGKKKKKGTRRWRQVLMEGEKRCRKV